MEFVAIDFEKLNDSQLSVCEVGLVVFKDGKEVGTPFHSYINPVGGLERNGWAKKNLCHISDEMLLEAPSYMELFPILQQIIKDKILVAHSKGADLNYIYNLEVEYSLPKLYTKWIDTKEVACNLGKAENLADLFSELFDIQLVDHHKALEDARACGLVVVRLSSEVDIHRYVHEEEYSPSDKRQSNDSSTERHTQYGTATVEPDGLVFNHDKISDYSFFKDKSVALSGMSVVNNKRIKSVLIELGAKCTSEPSGKTNVFIVDQNKVGPSKRIKAIGFQQSNGLLVITDDYFWKLVDGM